MVHVSIQHVIGTVALIGLVLSLASAYHIIVSSIEGEVIKTQLSQTAEYISMSLAHVISLTDFTYGVLDTTYPVTKHLVLPKTVSGKPYNFTILRSDGGYYVYVEVISRSDLHAKSPITVKSEQRIVILTNDDLDLAESLLEDFEVKPRPWVSGGLTNVVVWCYKSGDIIYAGLGIIEGG
ncbi:MAG: hypothetical protein QW335_03840 [Candidatus Nezhaarchaeales archaeon]